MRFHYLTAVIFLFSCKLLVAGQTITTLNLQTNDLVYDPFSNRVYASVPSTAGAIGNSITPINPISNTIGTSVFMGSEPTNLAISDDGKYIYAILSGASAVRRFDIPSQTAGLQFSFGSDSFNGIRSPRSISVEPGNHDTIAVSLRYSGVSPSFAGVQIIQNGVKLPNSIASSATIVDTLGFGANANTLYGVNLETTGAEFSKLAVNANGVSLTTTGALGVGDFKYAGGLIFTTSGREFDPETRTLLGTFSGATGAIAADPANHEVFYLSGNTIKAYDIDTFLPLGQITVPGVVGTSGSLIRFGTDGLAFRTPTQVFLIHSTLVPEPSTWILSGSGGLAVMLVRRRAARNKNATASR